MASEKYLAKIDRMIEVQSANSYPVKNQNDFKPEFDKKFQVLEKLSGLDCGVNFTNFERYRNSFETLYDLLVKIDKQDQNETNHVCLYRIGEWFNNKIQEAYETCWKTMKPEMLEYCDKRIGEISQELIKNNNSRIRQYQTELDKLWEFKYKMQDVIESMNELSIGVPDGLKEKMVENDVEIVELDELIKNEPLDEDNFSVKREFVIWNKKRYDLLNKIIPVEFVEIFEEKLNSLFPYRELSQIIITRCNSILGWSDDESGISDGGEISFLYLKGISPDSGCELDDFKIQIRTVKKYIRINRWLC